jgi:hypothetical protein
MIRELIARDNCDNLSHIRRMRARENHITYTLYMGALVTLVTLLELDSEFECWNRALPLPLTFTSFPLFFLLRPPWRRQP